MGEGEVFCYLPGLCVLEGPGAYHSFAVASHCLNTPCVTWEYVCFRFDSPYSGANPYKVNRNSFTLFRTFAIGYSDSWENGRSVYHAVPDDGAGGFAVGCACSRGRGTWIARGGFV